MRADPDAGRGLFRAARIAAFLEKVLRAHSRELPGLGLAFAYIFLVVSAISLVKPLRNSLFIGAFGVGGLPYAYLGVAAASGLFIWLYARLSGRMGMRALICSGLSTGACGMIAFWAVLAFGGSGPAWNVAVAAFYVAFAVFAVIATSQVWLLVNLAFDARQAKRLFGTIASGGIAGGIAGGYLASYLAPRMGGAALPLLCAVLLGGAICAADALWKRAGTATGRTGPHGLSAEPLALGSGDRVRDLWGQVIRSPHASWLALMVGLATLAGSLAEYQFSSLAAESIRDPDKLTAFFGFWLSNLSVFSLILQLAFSYRLLRTYGVGISLMALPLAMAGGSLAVLVTPALWSGVLAKIGDGALKNSLNKSATELLYLPMPDRLREKAKMLIDVFVDNLATGLAGAMLLFLSAGGGMSPRLVSVLVLVLVAIWIPVILKVRAEYVNSFRKAMEKRAINVSAQTLPAGEAIILEGMSKALDGNNPKQIVYALDWLEAAGADRHLGKLGSLLSHPNAEVRLRTLQLLRRGAYPGFGAEAEGLVRADADREVRLAALRYLLRLNKDPAARVSAYLMEGDAALKETALHALCLEAKRREDLAAEVDWRSLLDGLEEPPPGEVEANRRHRVIRARIIGISGLPDTYPELRTLLADSDLEVRKTAIRSAGDTRDISFLPFLYPHLLTQATRILTRDALAAFGEESVAPLSETTIDPAIPFPVRRHIPRVLGLVGSRAAADALLALLPAADPSLRFEAIMALGKIKSVSPHRRLPSDSLDRAIQAELRAYYALIAILSSAERTLAGGEGAHPSGQAFELGLRLLARGLREKNRQAEERVFRLLGLRYETGDIYGAYLGLSSGNPGTKAHMLELLENVIPGQLKRLLFPMVEIDSPARLEEETRSLTGMDGGAAWPGWMESLLLGHDDWIRVLALHLAGRSGDARLRPLVGRLLNYPDARVKDAAFYAVGALASGSAAPGEHA